MRFSALLLLCAGSLPAQADLQSNLLANGGGESRAAAAIDTAEKKPFYTLPGWATKKDLFVAQTGPWAKVEPIEGKRFLRAEKSGGTAHQEVDLLRGSSGRPRHLLCTGRMRHAGKDRGEIRVAVLDASGAILAEATTGLRSDKAWAEHRLIVAVPADGERARVTLRAVRRSGEVCDAVFDDLALEGIGEGFPPPLAGTPVRDLIAELEATPSADHARRRGLAVAMVGHGGDEVVRYLTEQLDGAEEPAERERWIELLALTQNQRVAPLFKNLLVSKDARERAHSAALAPLLTFDWRSHLAKAIGASKKAALRKAWLATLVDGSPASLKRLAGLYRTRKAAGQLEVLTAMRGHYRAEKTFAAFLQPNLRRKANGGLRHESMRQLAASRDPLYFEYLEQLYDDEKNGGRRSNWIRWCADYNSLDALFVMMPLVLETDIRAEGTFIDALGRMKAKQVGSHVRRRWVQAEEPLLRKGAIRLMTAVPWPNDLGELYRMCSDPDQGVATMALNGLAQSKEPQAAKLIARFVVRDTKRRAAPIVAAALHALWTATKGSEDTVVLTMQLAVDALPWQVRAAAIQLLGPVHGERARELFIDAFEDTKRQVRIAAYEAMTWLRVPATVVLLIDQLDDEETYVAHFIGDDLADLTGVHLGIEAEAWRHWWQHVERDFKCPPKPTAKKRPAAASGTATRYYNIPIRSDNIVFLIDLSGSMGAKVKGITKLAAAKKELIRVLEVLTPQHHFNIVAFDNSPRPYAEDLRRATKTEVREAIKYVKKLKLGGATNIYDTLELAFDMGELESVFLLTDGAPTAGSITAKDEILEVLRRDNSYMRVRINTISIGGTASDRSFLDKLAGQNWGTATKQ